MIPHTIFITGLTAAGKSTLSRLLQKLLQCDLLSLGDILREKYPSDTIKARDIPECEIFKIVSGKVFNSFTNILLIDNFPVNWSQLDFWKKSFPYPLAVIHLKIEETLERAMNRLRIDDTEETYTNRKIEFETKTAPVIEFLSSLGLVYGIDATQEPKKIVEAAIKIIRQKLTEQNLYFCDHTSVTVEKQTELAVIPYKSAPFNSGFCIHLPKSILIEAHKTETHSIAIYIEIQARSAAMLVVRPNISTRGILLHNMVINSGNLDSIELVISNLTSKSVFIDSKEAVAEIIFLPVLSPNIVSGKLTGPWS